MAKLPVLSSSRPRALNIVFIAFFIILSAAGLWYMRISTVINGVPANFDAFLAAGHLEDGTELKTTYTGFGAIDSLLSLLVLAFSAGPFGHEGGLMKAQQIHFLVNFYSVICIWTVESCRERNQWRLISL